MISPEMMMAMASPQQREAMAKAREMAKNVRAEIRSRKNGLDLTLLPTDPQSEAVIPQITQTVVASIAQSLDMLYGIKGTWDRSGEV